jgi:hypothetical protein
MGRKPSRTLSKAAKRLRKGDSIAALAVGERGQIKRLRKRCAKKRATTRRSRRS